MIANVGYVNDVSLLYNMYMYGICLLSVATFHYARSPGGSKGKMGLPVQFSVHYNHSQMTNS